MQDFPELPLLASHAASQPSENPAQMTAQFLRDTVVGWFPFARYGIDELLVKYTDAETRQVDYLQMAHDVDNNPLLKRFARIALVGKLREVTSLFSGIEVSNPLLGLAKKEDYVDILIDPKELAKDIALKFAKIFSQVPGATVHPQLTAKMLGTENTARVVTFTLDQKVFLQKISAENALGIADALTTAAAPMDSVAPKTAKIIHDVIEGVADDTHVVMAELVQAAFAMFLQQTQLEQLFKPVEAAGVNVVTMDLEEFQRVSFTVAALFANLLQDAFPEFNRIATEGKNADKILIRGNPMELLKTLAAHLQENQQPLGEVIRNPDVDNPYVLSFVHNLLGRYQALRDTNSLTSAAIAEQQTTGSYNLGTPTLPENAVAFERDIGREKGAKIA